MSFTHPQLLLPLLLPGRSAALQFLQRHRTVVGHIAALVELPALLPDVLLSIEAVIVEALQILVILEAAGFSNSSARAQPPWRFI